MTNTDDHLVAILLTEVPELRPRYDALVEAWSGDEPDTALMMEELADLLMPWLTRPSRHGEALQRAFAAVEHVAIKGGEAETAVAYAFLDALAPEALGNAIDLLGPCTTGILAALEDGTFDPDSDFAGDAEAG